MTQMKAIREPEREVPVDASVDVVVAGGGPAGIAAALGAAKAGARVLLVERYAFLGGMATAALMCAFGTFNNYRKLVIRGVAEELIEAVRAAGGANTELLSSQWIWVDVETLKKASVDLLEDAGVELLFHTMTTSPVVDGSRVAGIFTENKSGRRAITARVTVDATGDGDIYARAGCDFEKGRPEDGMLLPMSIAFRMAGVDDERHAAARARDKCTEGRSFHGFWQKMRESGDVDIPLDGFMHLVMVHPGEYNIHATRVLGVDGSSGSDLSRAEIIARRQAWTLAEYMKKHMPGFEKAYVSQMAVQIGVRETRRLKGLYQLTGEDVLSARKFEDGVGRGCYQIDLHNVKGAGIKLVPLPKGEHYGIPYRILVPEKVDGLLAAGRPVSATHEAHGSLRVMSHCMATGHAAGVAAALAAEKGIEPRDVNTNELRTELIRQNALV